MFVLFDIAILLVFFFTVYAYYRRDFVDVIFGFGKTVISVVLSAIFGRGLGVILYDKYFNEKIVGSVYNSLLKIFGNSYATGISSEEELVDSLPNSLAVIARGCGVDFGEVYSSLLSTSNLEERMSILAHGIGDPIALFVSNLIGYILIFLVAYLVLVLVGRIICGIFELPGLRMINKFLGILVGCVCGAVIVFVLVCVAQLVIYFIIASSERTEIIDIINKTVIFKRIWLGGM